MNKIKMKVLILFTAIIVAAGSTIHAAQAKNVVLLIGDGMGPAIIGLSKNYSDFVLKKPGLNIERLMNEGRTGFMMTYSSSHLVTDSAAGATAFACGIKTYNEAIGVDANGNTVETILEKAKKAGKSAGLVTTTDLADATPACFYAHAARRAQRNMIAPQGIAEQKVDIMLGGGSNFFDTAEAIKTGYRVLTTRKGLEDYLEKLPVSSGGNISGVLGLFAEKEFAYYDDRNGELPTLPQMATLALATLKRNPKGFFLMVEGGRIDHAGHANFANKMVREFLEFDEVIALALDFQQKNPDTLVIVTADHDTGGLALSKGDIGQYPKTEDLTELAGTYWISHNHTGSPVLLAAKGPGQEKVKGMNDNTDVFKIMKEVMDLK